MKKYLKILIVVVLSIINIKGVKAEKFYEDNYISGVYATYKKDDFTKAQLMRFIKREKDNLPVYCLTPSDTLYEGEIYTARFDNIDKYLGISIDKYKRISEIAYFGYKYQNHTEEKWYAITQFMLWKEMDPDADIYYTNKFKGNRITRFEEETNEIETLIANYNKIPSIKDLNLTINKKYEIYDSNQVLDGYEIESNDGLDIKINNNKLVINPKKKGTFKVKLIRKDGIYSHNTIPYTANKGQDILVRGSIERPTKKITINVTGGDLQISKIDSETLSSEARGEASIVGANYGLYDHNNKLVNTLIINDKGFANINDLEYGNYTLKEIKAPIGYNLDLKTYQINIDSNNEKLELKEDIIKGKLVINKYLKDEKLLPETNISFKIYDSNNNLIDTITTNKLGSASIELIYGKYKIVQQNTTLGYKKLDDFYITIDSNEDKIINLEDDRIKGKLKIIKKDLDNNKNIILSNTEFKIKNILTNTYINNTYKTDNNGVLNIDIRGGKYLLEEIKAPNGYIKGENKEFIIDQNNNTLEMIVYNKKQYGKIEITKNGKLLNNNLILLKDVKFNIYALEDIITSDNELHYKKDDLVDVVTTDINGKAISKKLPIGKYYIEEISTMDNFIIDKNKYVIDLNNNLNDEIIIKKINITNNEKEVIKEKNNNLIEKTTIYPKTSNKDIYINTIASYFIFIGLMLIISGLKHEK